MALGRRSRSLLAVTLAALAVGGCGGGDDDSQTPPRADEPPVAVDGRGTLAEVPAIYRSLEPSVVAVEVPGAAGGGEGSGVVYEPRQIVTNHHVIAVRARSSAIASATGSGSRAPSRRV